MTIGLTTWSAKPSASRCSGAEAPARPSLRNTYDRGSSRTSSRQGGGIWSLALLLSVQRVVVGATAAASGRCGTPVIVLSGQLQQFSGLTVTGGGTTIRGLVINDFLGGDGIALIGAGGNVIAGNFIGTDVSGTQTSPYPTVPGCSCSNLIMNSAIRIENSPDNLIGGQTIASRNVIVGSVYGVQVLYSQSTRNLIQGNYIGLDVAGTAGLANSVNIYVVDAPANTIGGTSVAARNVIGANQSYSVFIANLGADANVVQGNYIGTDFTGTVALSLPGSGGSGILTSTAPNTLIGGTQSGAGNLISGYFDGPAILIYGGTYGGSGRVANTVQGNLIGTKADGVSALPNLQGIYIVLATGNAIGGTAVGARNTIAFNRAAGVYVHYGTSNAILSNSIHSNGDIGIDLIPDNLAPDGVTKNDRLDGDTGANGLQNYPTLGDTSRTSVAGSLDTARDQSFFLQFFRNDTCDASKYGEGQTLVGMMTVVTDKNGHAWFVSTFAVPVNRGDFVTSTATDAAGNTSEFSRCATVE